jgi:tetratricopeptide (TPR) repeat protein
MQGRLGAALAANQEALAIRRDIADSMGVSISLFNVGEVLALQGDLAGAMRHLDEALALQRKLEIKRGMGFSLHVLGDIALAQGDTVLARTRVQEAIDIRTKLGEKITAAESQNQLALVALAAGDAAEAEALARRALEVFAGQNRDLEALGRVTLARALLTSGNAPAALAEATQARDSIRGTQNTLARLSTAIAVARIQAVAQPGTGATALTSLQGVEAEARRLGWAALGLEAALAQAEIATRQQRPDAGARVAALIKDAQARGYGLVAARASALQAPRKT